MINYRYNGIIIHLTLIFLLGDMYYCQSGKITTKKVVVYLVRL